MAAFSPRKLNLSYQASPKTSAHKRSLFPTSSPQTNDLGIMTELDSEDSEVYSPPFTSPSLSVTPSKNSPISCSKKNSVACNLNFNSPRRSPRNKSLINVQTSSNKSLQKSSRKGFLEREKFDDLFVTLLPDVHEKEKLSEEFKMKTADSLTTPKKRTDFGDKYREVRRSPRSASKKEVIIKPNSFYGKAAPILATNQTNRIQGMKCVFRPPQQSRAKAKLNFEDKPNKKRERSRSMDSLREAKRRKPVFTGVHHAIPKPVKHSPEGPKPESIREKARKVTDLSRTPYNVKKRKSEGWEYTLRFSKPLRYEEGLGEKRKFFKTMVRDPIISPSSQKDEPIHFVPQKRIKLLDTQKCYLEEKSPLKAKINTSDIQELLEDDELEKLQDKPEVDDILLRLEEEEDDETKKREAERQMLMNILENSPMKFADIDSLSNCTASLDLNDSFSNSGCSRFSLDDGKENKETPPRFFSIFKNQSSSSSKKVLSDVTQRSGSSSKKKWRGIGENQLQIDAGQKRYGAQQCAECGMLYQAGEAEDEMQHSAFHNNLTTLRHPGWKNENVVGYFDTDYVIVVTSEDAKSWQKKAQEVLALVDKSLGITPELSSVKNNQKIFLYVADKRIVGCMVASPLTRAYKMISSESDVDICSEESYTVRCGVSRMWTLYTQRRRGVASRLLDTVRRNFMYGHILSREDIAFSIPTPDGKRFVTKYMDTPNFFVYTGY